MTFIIRKAVSQDGAALIKLMTEHAAYEGHNLDIFGEQQQLDNLANLPVTIFVVETQGNLLGYMSVLKQFSTWDMSWYLYLDFLYLNEQTRGQGLGLKLMQILQQHAKEKQLTNIQWQTPNDNL